VVAEFENANYFCHSVLKRLVFDLFMACQRLFSRFIRIWAPKIWQLMTWWQSCWHSNLEFFPHVCNFSRRFRIFFIYFFHSTLFKRLKCSFEPQSLKNSKNPKIEFKNRPKSAVRGVDDKIFFGFYAISCIFLKEWKIVQLFTSFDAHTLRVVTRFQVVLTTSTLFRD
jgi:hypothetical protein